MVFRVDFHVRCEITHHASAKNFKLSCKEVIFTSSLCHQVVGIHKTPLYGRALPLGVILFTVVLSAVQIPSLF